MNGSEFGGLIAQLVLPILLVYGGYKLGQNNLDRLKKWWKNKSK